MFSRLYQQVSAHSEQGSSGRLVIAYSGGVDSAVLLHALASQPQFTALKLSLHALHINHQLHSDSHAWQQHCQQQCAALNIPFSSIMVTINTNSNLEAAAREARFTAFNSFLNDDDVLLLAHHANDQAETMLYRLFRGAGVKGLSGIDELTEVQNMTVMRPLLDASKAELQAYADEHNIAAIFDGSNDDMRFDRNFLRHQVIPVIESRWPKVLQRFANSSKHLREADELLAELAQLDLADAIKQGVEPCLSLASIKHLSLVRQKNALRYWLAQHQLRASEKTMQALEHSFIHANHDAQPELLLEGKLLRRFDDCVYISEPYGDVPKERIPWRSDMPIALAHYGELSLHNSAQYFEFEVRYRQGGERIQLAARQHSTSVKKLLQALKIEPWRRDWLPLLYYQGELIAVADKAISQKGKDLLGSAEFTVSYSPV